MPIFMKVDGVKGAVTEQGHSAADGGLQKVGPGTLVLSGQNETTAFDLTFQDGDPPSHVDGIKVYVDVVYNHTAEGGGPRVIVFDGRTDGPAAVGDGQDLIIGGTPDQAYDPSFRGGIPVAAGDLDRDAVLDNLLAAGEPAAHSGGMLVALGDGSVRSVGSSADIF